MTAHFLGSLLSGLAGRAFGGARRFARDEGGMTLPLVAMSMVMMTAMTGLAIDIGRVQMAQSKLLFSLDAAGLAAGSTVSTTNLNTEAAKYLNANYNGYMGSIITGTSVTSNSTNTVFTLTATASVPTAFMAVVGINNVTINATSQISRAVTGLELVLVLDNTGSMGNSAGGGVSKIAALRSAATTLVNTLFGDASTATNGKLWVGLVPFSHAVNIGTTHTDWVTNSNSLNQNWNGCVDARQGGYDVVDDPPTLSKTNTLFSLRSYTKSVTKYGVTTTSNVSSCTPSSSWSTTTTCTAKGTYTYSSPLESSSVNGSGTLSYGQAPSCSQEITPMTNQSSTLLTAISNMTASGNTVINQGLVWSWYMLSPRWRGYWGGTMAANSLPLDYNTKGMVKAVVLLTDGENTISDTLQGSYWYSTNNWTGSNKTATAESNLDAKTRAICTSMKNAGVYIYTIALGTDTTTASLKLLQDCATATNYYFNSPSTTQLQDIFNSIGDSLSNLRVSK